MGLLSNIGSQIWDKFLIILGVLLVLLPSSPLNMPLTYRDSGVFLYIGWRVLSGELPYRDIWDHKPPFIYYINELGLAISSDSRWGVWLIEFIAVFLAAFIGFKLIKKVLGVLPAIFVTFFWLLILVFVIEGGNLTEEYVLPLQFACLWLVYDFEKSRFPQLRLFLIGLLCGIAFFMKQTTIGIGIAIVSYLAIRRLLSGQTKHLFREMLVIVGGGLLVFIMIATFFILQGVFQQFWSAAFEYNLANSSSYSDVIHRIKPIIRGIAPLSKVGIFQFALIGYIIGIIGFLFKKEFIKSWLSLLPIALIGLPIEFFLLCATGKSFAHYFISVLPIISLFVGLAFWVLITFWGSAKSQKIFFTIGVIGIFIWSSGYNYVDQIKTYRKVNNNALIT